MKKTIVMGSLLAIFLVLMAPNIGAVQYQSIESTIKQRIHTEYENRDVLNQLFSSNLFDGPITKIVSLFLFALDFIFILFYYISFEYIPDIALNIAFLFMDTMPAFSVFLIGFLTYGLAFLAMAPTLFVVDLIEKIGVWDTNTILKIHNVLLTIGGIIMFILNYLEILDIFPNASSVKGQEIR